MLSWETIIIGAYFFSSWNIILGEMYHGTLLEVFLPRNNTEQNLTHYCDAVYLRRCIGISWYFCTYNDTDLIGSYTKVCVHYGMFLFVHLQYVPGDFPNMSQGTLTPFGTKTESFLAQDCALHWLHPPICFLIILYVRTDTQRPKIVT